MEATKAFERAIRYYCRMYIAKKNDNKLDFEDFTYGFLSSGRNVYHYIETEFKGENEQSITDFNDWYDNHICSDVMKNSIFGYIREKRNFVIHKRDFTNC